MAERLKNYNVIASVRFNGQLIDGLVAVFDVEDEDWVDSGWARSSSS